VLWGSEGRSEEVAVVEIEMEGEPNLCIMQTEEKWIQLSAYILTARFSC
jgi:hypothetical protein